jgi:hypothetical protein
MPRHLSARRLFFPTFALLGVIAIAGCPNKKTEDSGKAGAPGQRLSGTVTYEGKPIPFGVVRFYHMDQNNGSVPIVSGLISADGTYTVSNIATGLKMVCVATDPDMDPTTMLAPPMDGPGGMGGKPPMGGGPPVGGGGPPMAGGPPVGGGGPPMAGGPPMGGGGPPMGGGGPPMAGGPPMVGGGPPMAGGPPMVGGGPPMVGGPPMGGGPDKPSHHRTNPLTSNLTDAQKEMLVKVDQQYGKRGKSPLIYNVTEGENTYNIVLPLK